MFKLSYILNTKIICIIVLFFSVISVDAQQRFQLNNGLNRAYLCGNNKVKLYVTSPTTGDFELSYWSFNDQKFGFKTNQIEVSNPGVYKAHNGPTSIGVKVIKMPSQVYLSDEKENVLGAELKSCPSETNYFKVSKKSYNKSSDYSYQWQFKSSNGTQYVNIVDANNISYSVSGESKYGSYRVVVSPKKDRKGRTDGNILCSPVISKEITIKPKESAGFTVKAKDDIYDLLFWRGVDVKDVYLEIEHTAKGKVEIIWYKDDVAIPGSNLKTFPVQGVGSYYAEVKEFSGSSSCQFSVRSRTFNLFKPEGFKPVLGYSDDYQECVSQSASLVVKSVKVLYGKGKELPVKDNQLDYLDFDWFYDDKPLNLENKKQTVLPIKTYQKNGEYKVNVLYSDEGFNVTTPSKELFIKLVVNDNSYFNIVSSSKNNLICPGGEPIKLQLEKSNPDFTYQWYKNNQMLIDTDYFMEATEPGLYKVVVNAYGCEVSKEIIVKNFTNDAVKVSPGLTLPLVDKEFVTATVTGADSYKWYNEAGDEVSSTDTFQVSEVGKYILVAQLGKCFTDFEINVVEDDGKIIISNVLSPFNADGINDFWQLPNRLAFNEKVRVVIYDSKGNEIYNTVSYQNNWPENPNLLKDIIYYYKILKEDKQIKAGTLSILN